LKTSLIVLKGEFKVDYVLRTDYLTKQYKGINVVNNININVKQGEIYGFLGENGAGKTTTIRMIAGLIPQTSGEIELFGKKKHEQSKRHFERIGAIIEFPGSYPNLSVYDNLEIHRRLMGIPDKKETDWVIDLVQLMDAKKKKAKELSLGMKQRLGIARSLLHHPDLLILDEPTNGLDPKGIKEIRQLLKRLAEDNKITIFLSSHILSEVQQMADTIGVIHKGNLLKEIETEKVMDQNKHYLQIRVDKPEAACQWLEKEFSITKYSVSEENVIKIYEKFQLSGEINRILNQKGIFVDELVVMKDTLEDYFLKLTGGGIS
jgi:bacitracin transport system ATP-binding protein